MARIHKLWVLVLILMIAAPCFVMASDNVVSSSNDNSHSADAPEESPGEVEKEEEIEPDPFTVIIKWLFSLPARFLRR